MLAAIQIRGKDRQARPDGSPAEEPTGVGAGRRGWRHVRAGGSINASVGPANNTQLATSQGDHKTAAGAQDSGRSQQRPHPVVQVTTRMGYWGRQLEDRAVQETGEPPRPGTILFKDWSRAGGQGKVRARGPRKGGGRLTGFQGVRAVWTRAANCCNLQNSMLSISW